MEKWNEKYIELLSAQWDEAMRGTDNFSAEIRSKADVDKHEEKNVRNFDRQMGSSDERVTRTLEYISRRGYMGNGMTALDIGAGTGVFTIPFAEKYSLVTSLDISAPMQEKVIERAAGKGLRNIEFVIQNWKEADISRMGFENRFDMVISSINCRGVCSYETLDKMNHASRGGCCLLTWAGYSKQAHTKNLQRLIIGRELETAGGNDIYFPFSIIYHLGGIPELTYSTVGWENRIQPGEAVENICFNYWRFADITDAIREKIEKYVYANLENGLFVEQVEHRIGIMVWDAWRIKEQRQI